MRAALITFFILCLSAGSFAQSDLLILKKHNRNVQSFFPGSSIRFYTDIRYYEAYITSIQRDSLFLVQYDVRQVYNSFNVLVADTVAAYRFAVNYHEIVSLGKNSDKNFDWTSSGGTLLGGGTLLTLGGLSTWIFSKPHTRYYASKPFVIGSAALAATGYLISKKGSRAKKLGKKYTLSYISINP